MIFTPRLICVAGNPGSGKDLLLGAMRDMGSGLIQVIPKRTTRHSRRDDGDELIFDCAREEIDRLCDVTYENYGDCYGIDSRQIWSGLEQGTFQILVVSDLRAIGELRARFGDLCRVVFVYSEITADQYQRLAAGGKRDAYAQARVKGFDDAVTLYGAHVGEFDHVLLHVGTDEDLVDQVFRLLRSYQRNDL